MAESVPLGADEIFHRADCALNTTHHLTCTCDYHTRWREREIPLHDAQCSWVRTNEWGNLGNCDCGAPDQDAS